MAVQRDSIFIVQTAESNGSGKTRGSQIALINKQSALYKYRQQRKRKESSKSTVPAESTPVQSLGTQRTSWLLESRLPRRSPSIKSAGSSASHCRSSEDDDEDELPNFSQLTNAQSPNRYDMTVAGYAQFSDCYAGLRTDPFSCMPVENSSLVLDVSDLYTNMMIPHVSQIAKVCGVNDFYLGLFWTMVFQEDTIDTVVAMSYCAQATLRRSIGYTPKKDIFFHRAKSLAILQQKLSDLDTSSIGTTVLILMYNCNISRSLGDLQAADQYKAMIRHLLKRFSLESLGYGGRLKHHLMQWEYFLTLGGEEPLFERTECFNSIYPTFPLRGDLADIVNTLPNGFKLLANDARLSCQVLHVLGRAQRMVDAVRDKTIQAFLSAPTDSPYPDFCAAIPCLGASKDGTENFERLLCCAIILLTSRLLSPIKTAHWCLPTIGSRTILTQEMFNCKVTSEVEKDCLIWMWLITIDSWGLGSEGIPQQSNTLVRQLKERYPRTSDWSYTSRVTNDFFWNNELDTSCADYWRLCSIQADS